MKFRLIITGTLVFFFSLKGFAQENKTDTLRWGLPFLRLPSVELPSLLRDSFLLPQRPAVFELPQLSTPEFLDSAQILRNWEHVSYIRRPKPEKPFLPFELAPNLNFNLNASHWYLPVLGGTTTFSPVFTYAPLERLSFFGGVHFTQYHHLSYVQSIVAPGWPTRSNITSQGFLGAAFVLNDRITLRSTYQQSLYNQLPGNLIMFAPSYRMATFGADVDVWNGLGVSVERVWMFNPSGGMKSGMRYSPYINVDKFLKFLRGD
ncbi:MAG: hypothetical protein LBB64_06855 [Dysgonamonadaceae bacterium]|jgi:hypothetical protein|nr:hypothetical protein [Dysgonamonadaceae bacterium]